MSIQYLINGIDFTSLVFGSASLIQRVGKNSSFATNNLSVNVYNNNSIFSPEDSNSLIYFYRANYSGITIEIKDNDMIIWSGIVENIERSNNTSKISCVEAIIEILSVEDNFVYKNADGHVGDRSYAGSATPAEHQLAILRRYLNDDNIDVRSFKALKSYQSSNSVLCECQVDIDSEKTAFGFVGELCFETAYLYIENNKVSIKWYTNFLGDYGVQINNYQIINVKSISKDLDTNKFYSYSVIYDDTGTPTEINGSLGDNGSTSALSATTLTDLSQSWEINEWKDKYVFIGAAATKDILKITGNNKTQLFFTGGTKVHPQNYVIVENDNTYSKDYSDYPLKVTSGASFLGSIIIQNISERKLKAELKIFDDFYLRIGDNILITVEDEGIITQPFEIQEIRRDITTNIADIVCLDRILYPLLENYQVTRPSNPQNLVGIRQEDGSAVLWWDVVEGASYYKIIYGTLSPTYVYYTTSCSEVVITDYLEKWLGYYFWVIAVNYIGIESERSDSLYLDKVDQVIGYIDGTSGYFVEKYRDWGILEDYYFLITYKNVSYTDIGFMIKSPIVALDRSQAEFTEEISQDFADQSATDQWGTAFRRMGYIDGAGTSNYLPEFVNDGGVYKIKNPMSVRLTLNLSGGVTVTESGDTIAGSEDWFLQDGLDLYYTYWFQTGIMMDISNNDLKEWFRVFKINQAMGLFETGTGIISNNTFTDTSKSWEIDQWENYYVGIINNAITYNIEWYKIASNTDDTLTIVYEESSVSGKQYVINNQPYTGFQGVLMDDVWDSMYREERNMSEVDSNTTSDWAGDEWLTDTSKSWNADMWAGFYISIEGGTALLVTGNSNDELWFTGNLNTGAGKAYQIQTKLYVDTGQYYWQHMSDFILEMVANTENNSYSFYRSWTKSSLGIFILNTWCENWTAYASYVQSVNNRYQHFIMFEALQCTWSLANEVTKQFIISDWNYATDRWDQMKIQGGVGYARLAILGYPPHQQMFLSHIAGSLLLSRYSDKKEDITAAGNIILDQLFYDMVQAGNKTGLQTFGRPASGWETSYTQSTYDKYGLCLRKFLGAYVIYNPSNQIRVLEYVFDDDVACYHTGNTYSSGVTYTIYFLPRTTHFFFKNNVIGEDAYNFLIEYAPYTYLDWNACWIVFTPTGVSNIGNNSVWIDSGYTNNKRFVTDGDQAIPVGTAENLFHAGDGSTTSVDGHSPSMEIHTGVLYDEAIELTSQTILAVVAIYNDTEHIYLSPGIDYLVEFGDADASVSGKGKWATYIEFLTQQEGDELEIYFYEQGLDGDGYPETIVSGDQIEFGILYRQESTSGFELRTGGINNSDCNTYLEEYVDYYIIPEGIRWKWDYRYNVFGTIAEDKTYTPEAINTNQIKRINDDKDKKGIHWGNIDAENAILVRSNVNTSSSYNGKKAVYSSKTIQKPKVLIYGFTVKSRNNELEPYAIASRPSDTYLFENQIKLFTGIYYDEVWVTGDWDGVIQTGSSSGAWGSINGIINDTSNVLDSVSDVINYFDVVILNDTFLEYVAGSISGKTQWASWLDQNDYLLLKNFKKNNPNGMVIDRRAAFGAFVWYGGIEPVLNIMINRGTDLLGTGELLQSDLTNVAGILYYGGVDISELADEYANLYIDQGGNYVKYSSTMTTDFRINNSDVPGVTDHYDVDVENGIYPIYNVWENNGSWITYIPRSAESRELFTGGRENSNLFLLWKDITSLQSGEDNFQKYKQLDLDNIIFRREPAIIFHRSSFFNLQYVGSNTYYFGNNNNGNYWLAEPGPFLSDAEQYCAVCPLNSTQDADTFIAGKYLRLNESDDDNFKTAFTFDMSNANNKRWNGYNGNYISAVETKSARDYGWILPDELQLGFLYWWGPFFDAAQLINWGKVMVFDMYNDETSLSYGISKTYNSDGCIPYSRDTSNDPPLEGSVSSIVKDDIGGTITITVNFDVNPIDLGYPKINGTVMNASLNIYNFSKKILTLDKTASSYWNSGYYIHITKADGDIDIFEILSGAYGLGSISNDQVMINTGAGYNESLLINRPYEIRESNQKYKLSLFRTTHDENVVFNASVISKDNSLQTLTINLDRGVNDTTGYVIAYQADDDSSTDNEDGTTTTTIANKDIMGGRLSGSDGEIGVDIATVFHPNEGYDIRHPFEILEVEDPINKPRGLYHYEYAYRNLIQEFGYEQNTGMVTCQAFYAHGHVDKPPVLLWPGVSVEDVHVIIQNKIGTKITFNNLQVKQGDIFYFYYNSFNDMLRIKEEDVDDSFPCIFKKDDLRGNNNTLQRIIVGNSQLDYFKLDSSYLDNEDILL